MLQFLPIEIILQITDNLNSDDIYSLSRIPEFEFLFHRITDNESMNFFCFKNNRIRSDVLKSFRRYTSARFYLIEITEPFEFNYIDFNIKFKNVRKVICLVNNNDGDSKNLYNDLFLKKLFNEFSVTSNTKFKFVNIRNIEIEKISNLNYSLISCDKILNILIKNCNSIIERQTYNYQNVNNLTIENCSNEVIKNFNFNNSPTNNLNISFKEINELDLRIESKSSKLLNVGLINLITGDNVENLLVSFNEDGYINEISLPNLRKFELEINSENLPIIQKFNSNNVAELSIKDNFDSITSCELFGGSNFQNLTSISFELNNLRLLNSIKNFNLYLIRSLQLKINEVIKNELNTLDFQNLELFSIEISGNCNEIPVLNSVNLKSLEIINKFESMDIKIQQDMKLNKIYPNLSELIINNGNLLISNLFENNSCNNLTKIKLLNVLNIPNLINFNECKFPDLEFIEINGIVNSMIFHELEINIDSPKLKTIVVKIDELNEEFNHEQSIWENYLHELNLKLINFENLKNLIINNINMIYIRNLKNLEKIIHGGDLDLQYLDADYLPNLKVLTYKNLNLARPIQSVNYINPNCIKKILKDSLHPLPNIFSV